MQAESPQDPESTPDTDTSRNDIDRAPRSWFTDAAAGVELRTSRDPYQTQVVFADGKPSDEIRTFLKSQGFRWNPDATAWVRPIQFATAAQDREAGRRVAGEVAKMLRAEKGIAESAEVTPF